MPKGDEPRSTSTPSRRNILLAEPTLMAAPANTNWEGAFHARSFARWPGDRIPPLQAIAGEADIVNTLKADHTANGIDDEIHLDGHDPSQQPNNRSGDSAARHALTSIA